MSIPNKVVTIRPFESPWITSKVKRHTKTLLHKRFKRTNNLVYWESYKNIRNLAVSELRNSKKKYFDKLDELLSTSTTDSKIFWKTAKQFLNFRKSSSSIPTLKRNDYYAENDLQKANLLNTYFISQLNVIDDNKSLPELEPTQHSLNVIQTTCQDVIDVLRNLNVSKSCGPDLIREGADILDKPLPTVFNRSIDNCYFPSPWKDGNVTPIYKKDDKSAPSNYRPITVLSSVGKTMETCVHKRLYNYAIEHRILTPLQSGFIQGDSTTYQLLHTYHNFCEAIDNGKEIRVVFFIN